MRPGFARSEAGIMAWVDLTVDTVAWILGVWKAFELLHSVSPMPWELLWGIVLVGYLIYRLRQATNRLFP